ncbi:hypothetical protein BS47DRAFT_1394462 [Hydnum rufescens UP504]|uniref:Aminoglycoside phosphotransferase domain-containing protein n=1 Tax=Hydnum rufescens UP504 TaxID=1448309 RepID=A0A9P6AUG3_9AGAM|nr:hypothetical protein BS47DRAFT_1394462 [Hydnum rufescens UP504]
MPEEIDELEPYLAEMRRRQHLWYWRAYYSAQEFFTPTKQGAWSVWLPIWRQVATIRLVAAQTTIPVPEFGAPSPGVDHIVMQLATFFVQLRAMPPPPGIAIGSSQLRFGGPLDSAPEPVRTVHSVRHRLVFTHDDLALRNIMVADDDSGRIAALIDWECAAWLPDYWEYSKVVNWNYGEDRTFKERVSAFL